MVSVFYCPQCNDSLAKIVDKYACPNCGRSYPINDGIPSFVDNDTGYMAESFDVSAFEFLFQMEQRHFWHVGRREIILDLLERNCGSVRQSSVLEIGCGNGSVMAYLRQKGLNVEGGDLFMEALRFCQSRVGNVPLYQLDVVSLPFRNHFDVIGLFDVLEHIEDDEKALVEVNQALKPRGRVLISVPACKFLWSYADKSAHHKRRYSRRELITKLEQTGFTCKRVSYYMFFLFPLLVLTRTIGNFIRRNEVTYDRNGRIEFKTIPIVNGVLLWTLRVEKWLMRYVALPFGISLLVMAEKKSES